MRKRSHEVQVHRTIEVDVVVTCEVEPVIPAKGWDPGDCGSFRIVAMESEGGTKLDGMIDELSKGDVSAIEEEALMAAEDYDGGPDTLEEARGER